MADAPDPDPVIDLGGLTVADLDGRPDSVLVCALRRRLAERAEPPREPRVHYHRALG